MKRTLGALGGVVLIALAACSPALAQEAIRGWRGDGSGIFPNTKPSINWGRISQTMKGLRTQAVKPKSDGPGDAKPIFYGSVDDWLVLSPVVAEGSEKQLLEKGVLPNEANLQPDLGDKVGELQWKPVHVEGSLLYFNQILSGSKNLKGNAVYAHTYIYSPRAAAVFMRMKGSSPAVWLNGQLLDKPAGRYSWLVTLKAGWNRVLARVLGSRTGGEYDGTPEGTAYFQLEMYGGEKNEEYEETGILWMVEPPQAGRPSCYHPVVVGDRVYVTSSPAFLICYDKLTGKRLWTRYNGFEEFVTAEEREKFPDLFAKIDPKAKRFKELAESYEGTDEQRAELRGLHGELSNLLSKVDSAKYAQRPTGQEPGLASQPITDGKHIYTWSFLGIAACYDLDGNLKWKTLANEGPAYRHGYMEGPIIVGKEVVVEMHNVIGLDRETGAVKWKIPHRWETYFHDGTMEKSDQTDLVNYDGLGVYKPGVGFVPWLTGMRSGNTLYLTDVHSMVFMMTKLPDPLTEAPVLKMTEYNPWYMPDEHIMLPGVNWGTNQVLGSPLIHDGLIYTISTGGLLRVEEEFLKHVYAKLLYFNPITWAYPYPHGAGVCASPTLAGNNVYLFGSTGTALVIKPGPKYEVVARNRIERLLTGRMEGANVLGAEDPVKDRYPEFTVSSPVFDGNRLYYRAEQYLYCIGQK